MLTLFLLNLLFYASESEKTYEKSELAYTIHAISLIYANRHTMPLRHADAAAGLVAAVSMPRRVTPDTAADACCRRCRCFAIRAAACLRFASVCHDARRHAAPHLIRHY